MGAALSQRSEIRPPTLKEFALIAGLHSLSRIARQLPFTHEAGAVERGREISQLQDSLRLPSEIAMQHLRSSTSGWHASSTPTTPAHVPALIAFMVWQWGLPPRPLPPLARRPRLRHPRLPADPLHPGRHRGSSPSSASSTSASSTSPTGSASGSTATRAPASATSTPRCRRSTSRGPLSWGWACSSWRSAGGAGWSSSTCPSRCTSPRPPAPLVAGRHRGPGAAVGGDGLRQPLARAAPRSQIAVRWKFWKLRDGVGPRWPW